MTWANDNLADALVVTDSLAFGPETWPGAPAPTLESGEDVYRGSRSIWFKHVSAATDTNVETLTVDTWDSPNPANGAFGLDTWIRIYATTVALPTFSDLTLVVFNDDDGNVYGGNSKVVHVTAPSTTYYIQVGNYDDSEAGTLFVNVNSDVAVYHWSEWRSFAITSTVLHGAAWVVNTRDLTHDDATEIRPSVAAGQSFTYTSTDKSVVPNGVYSASAERLTSFPTDIPDIGGPEGFLARANSANQDGNSDIRSDLSRCAFYVDLTDPAIAEVVPVDDPDYPSSIGVEYGGDAAFVTGTLSLPAPSTQTYWETFTPGPNTYAETSGGGPVDAFHLLIVPESHYLGTKVSGLDVFQYLDPENDDASAVSGVTPLITWGGATLSDADVGGGSYAVPLHRHTYADYTHTFTTLGPGNTIAFAVINEFYLSGLAGAPAHSSHASWLFSTDPTIRFDYYPRPYRLLLPGPGTAPPLRQLQRDDITRQFTRNGPSSVQASIRQGPRGTYL